MEGNIVAKELRAKLTARIKRTSTVESFRFTLPQRCDFMPGQFLQVIFDENTRQNGRLNKYLSFSSSPTKGYIEVTKRLSASQFSERLNNLKINDEVLLRAPMGTCVFKDNYKKIGFLIGGIGITPVISIIEYAIDSRLDTDISLLYSNRSEEEIAFKKELDYWQGISRNIKVTYTVTDCQPQSPGCIFGYIDEELFLDKAGYEQDRVFFIFGPPKMVTTMADLCIDLGCSKENIKTEIFAGY